MSFYVVKSFVYLFGNPIYILYDTVKSFLLLISSLLFWGKIDDLYECVPKFQVYFQIIKKQPQGTWRTQTPFEFDPLPFLMCKEIFRGFYVVLYSIFSIPHVMLNFKLHGLRSEADPEILHTRCDLSLYRSRP